MNYNMNNGMNMMMGGATYAQMPQANMTQPLSEEDIKRLRQNAGGQFNLQVTETEFLASQCTHKHNGQLTLRDNPDGTKTCTICSETFRLIDATPEEAQQICDLMLGLLQSIKTYYVDIPDSYAKQYFTMIPLIKKAPKFYELALNNFNKYFNAGTGLNQNHGQYGFNLYNSVIGGGNPMMMGNNMNMGNPMVNNGMNNGIPMNNNMNMGNPMVNNGMNNGMPVNNSNPMVNNQQPNKTNGQAVVTKQFDV